MNEMWPILHEIIGAQPTNTLIEHSHKDKQGQKNGA